MHSLTRTFLKRLPARKRYTLIALLVVICGGALGSV